MNKLSNKNFQILDIGTETTKLFSKYLKSAKMIVWNGPMGYAEDERFANGTKAIIKAILKNRRVKTIIGGGETLSLLPKIHFRANIFISTGGGAMLKFLEGKILPGIRPLLISR